MDSSAGTFEIKKKIFLQGNFIGKYIAKPLATLSNSNLSKINILEGKLENVERCNFNSLFSITGASLYHQNAFNIELKLNDELIKDKYVFIEEFNNTTIYDVALSDHQIDDNDTFGVIKGKMICALEESCELGFIDNSYTISKEIDFGDYTLSTVNSDPNFFARSLRPFKKLYTLIKSKLF